MDNQRKELLYFQITDLWKRLCESHSELFDLTCDEYSLLLGSELEALEEKILEKQEVIAKIGILEKIREELIDDVNKHLSTKITNVTELITFFQNYENSMSQKHLFSFNSLLIDIIEKIQTQNRNNQLFINKALGSLRSIREEALGEKSYSTYTSKGNAKARSLSV